MQLGCSGTRRTVRARLMSHQSKAFRVPCSFSLPPSPHLNQHPKPRHQTMAHVRLYLGILPHTPEQDAFDRSYDDVCRASVKRLMIAVDARFPEESAEDRADFDLDEMKYIRQEALDRYLKRTGPDGEAVWSSEEEESEVEEEMDDGRTYVVDGEVDEQGRQVTMRGRFVMDPETGRIYMREMGRGVQDS